MNSREEPKGLGILEWIVLLAALVFTMQGTAGVVKMSTIETGIMLLIRQSIAVGLTDGAVLTWHYLRGRYMDATQRGIANIAMWVSLGVVGLFTLLYGAMSITALGLGKETPIDTGFGIMTMAQLVSYVVTFVIAFQVGGSVALILFIEQLSPLKKMEVESSKLTARLNRQIVIDFKTAQDTVQDELSTNAALQKLKSDLLARGYSEADADKLVEVARAGVRESKSGKPASVPLTVQEASAVESFFGMKLSELQELIRRKK